MATFTSVYHRKPYPAIDPSAPQNSMTGRSVLIAGATSGIGLATAHAYIKASASVIVILGRRTDVLSAAVAELEEARPANSTTKVSGKQCDIADTSQIDKLWSDLNAENLSIDILILNAAATAPSMTRLTDMSSSFMLNVLSNLHMADLFLVQGPVTGKALINVSTMAVHTSMGNQLSQAAYSSSKAAAASAFQNVADCKPVEEVQILNVHPGATLSESARKNGYDENSIPWDDPALPGSFFVWAATKAAAFLHGRFVWCNWDVDELLAMKSHFESEPGFLKIGLQGIPPISVVETFGKIAEWDKAEKSGR